MFQGAQAGNKPTVAILHFDTENVLKEPSEAGNLARIEVEKTERFSVLDRYETEEQIKALNLGQNCFSRSCLVSAGQELEVDYMISGTVERFGEKMVISLRQLNVTNEEIVRTNVYEYQNMQEELQRMIRISIRQLLEVDYDENMRDMLAYVDSPVDGSQMLYSSSGPRMGRVMLWGTWLTGSLQKNMRGDMMPTRSCPNLVTNLKQSI